MQTHKYLWTDVLLQQINYLKYIPICVAHDALSNYALRSAHTAQIVRCVLYVGYIEFRILRANYVVIKENILPTFGH